MLTLLIINKKELETGIKKEMEEHGMSLEKATKTAKDHLKENPHYYSIAQSVGLEDEYINEAGQIERPFVKRMGKVPSRLTALKKRKGTVVGTSTPGPTGAGVGY